MINIIIIMTKYKIKPYSYEQAKKIGVDIEPSTNPKYKIDIYTKEGKYITSIGARGYSDYPTFIEEDGKEYADYRRALIIYIDITLYYYHNK